jgi:thioesterase domain-containing protein/malonyl CoA-acyl carrier protein transacylase/acyl carrier protein
VNKLNPASISQEQMVDHLTETESKLARIWAELLQFDEVGIHDDYFALGGNSLLAVTLMARIESQLGAKLPLTTILEAPTVAQFARLLETRGSHTPLVVIRQGGAKTPLFLIHDADGETMPYRSLALHLDPEQTVYGLKALSKANHPILHTRIEDMAAHHIRTIKTVQPVGPYLLGGLCAGGLIAFEVARQLDQNGEKVAMVALMDVGDVDAREKPMRWARERLGRAASTIEQGEGHPPLRRVVEFGRTWARKAWNFAGYQTKSRAKMVRDHTRLTLFRLYLKLGLPMPSFLQNIPVRTAYLFAKGGYRPATVYNGELYLIRATSGTGIDEPHASRYDDHSMGWTPRTTQAVRSVDVPGGHSSMLQEPNVRVLATNLQSYMNEALKTPDRPLAAAVAKITTTARAATGRPVGADEHGEERSSQLRPVRLLLVSADNREALPEEAARLADQLEKLEDLDLPDVSFTLAVGRQAREWRQAVVAANRTEAIERLRKAAGKGVWTSSAPVGGRPVAFVLAGVGEHKAGAGRALYDTEPAFREAADLCAEILRPFLGHDIRESMFIPAQDSGNWLRGDGGVIKETRIAQPAAFVLDWALAQMWMSWGVKPAAVLGYSVGEYAAAALAGVLRLEDALSLVAHRAEWIEKLAEPGVMLAVPLTEAEILPRLNGDIWVAAANSPQATIIGGREDAIERLEEDLRRADVVTRRVASDQGSHTPLLNAVRPHLKGLAEGMRLQPPQTPMLSNVTGSWMSAAESRDANHWCEHMCGTLRFQDGLGELLGRKEQVLLEIGPGAGLSAMARQHPLFERERMGRVLASLPGAWDRTSDQETVAAVAGRLWVEGVDVDWERYYATEDRRRVPLLSDSVPQVPEAGYAVTAGDRAQPVSAPD